MIIKEWYTTTLLIWLQPTCSKRTPTDQSWFIAIGSVIMGPMGLNHHSYEFPSFKHKIRQNYHFTWTYNPLKYSCSIVKLSLNVPAIIIFSQKGAYFGSQTLPIGKLLKIFGWNWPRHLAVDLYSVKLILFCYMY